jgi:hypothetical protein
LVCCLSTASEMGSSEVPTDYVQIVPGLVVFN